MNKKLKNEYFWSQRVETADVNAEDDIYIYKFLIKDNT